MKQFESPSIELAALRELCETKGSVSTALLSTVLDKIEEKQKRDAKWSEYLAIILSLYEDKPDEHSLSLGDWKEQGGLPEFRAKLKMSLGELRAFSNTTEKQS